jgi:hypothetical protein
MLRSGYTKKCKWYFIHKMIKTATPVVTRLSPNEAEKVSQNEEESTRAISNVCTFFLIFV